MIGLLTIVVISGFATSAASAAGPFWHVGGSTFKGTEQIKLQNKGGAVLSLPSLKLEITCNTSISEGSTIEGNGTTQGQGKGRITYSSCKSNAAGCTVTEPITTNPIKSYLATAATQTHDVEVFEPGQGTLFVTIKLTGGGCLLAGSFEVSGGAVAELIPSGSEAQVGLLFFPKTPITKVSHEGVEKTVELKTKGLESAFTGAYGAKLQKGEKFGVFET